MIREQVEKQMKKALLSFAKKEDKGADGIAFFIHTKPTEEEPELMPKYFYAIDGTPVQENGKTKSLRFVQDILGKKLDLMGMEHLASSFLSQYFARTVEETKAQPKDLYLMITGADAEAKELVVVLYKKAEVIKNLNMEEIFGE